MGDYYVTPIRLLKQVWKVKGTCYGVGSDPANPKPSWNNFVRNAKPVLTKINPAFDCKSIQPWTADIVGALLRRGMRNKLESNEPH